MDLQWKMQKGGMERAKRYILSVRLIMHVHVIEGNWQIAVNLIAHN